MILEKIAQSTRKRVEEKKKEIPLPKIRTLAEQTQGKEPFLFEKALSEGNPAFICEVKKASPSKGIIAPEFPYLQIAREYEAAGAAAISCLTEPEFFLGRDQYLQEIARQVAIPVLRKDFTIDPYQIYEAKVLGADAVLLICSLLDEAELKTYLELAGELGLSALVEAHDEEEIHAAINAGARIIGVNNRNLKDFSVNAENCLALRSQVPEGILFVAESGIRTAQDIEKLRKAKVDAVLIGETLMRSPDKKKMLEELKGLKGQNP